MADRFDVEFFGEKFATVGAPSDFALGELAEAADEDDKSIRGFGVTITLALDVLADPGDEKRFRRLARLNRASVQDLMRFVQASTEAAAERPTSQPSDSSGGLDDAEPKSDANSAGSVSPLNGRPDLQLAVMRTVGAA